MALYEIIYVSVAPGDMAAAELSSLMDKAREHNARRGITGMLLYHNREFMQLLEGEEAEVKALYDAICDDDRHQQVYKMWEGPIAERNFSSWSMGFLAPDDAMLRGRPGYEPLLEQGLMASSRDSTGKKMLLRVRDDFLCTDRPA